MLNEAGSCLVWSYPKVLILTPGSKAAPHSVTTERSSREGAQLVQGSGESLTLVHPGTGTSSGLQNPENCGGKNRCCRTLGANQPCHGSHRKALRGGRGMI